jgi:hypothetical protein
MHLNCDSKDDEARDFVEIQGKSGMKLDVVEGTSVEWKLDTGAANTIITEDTYLSILPEHRPVLERVRKIFHTADDRRLKVIGTAKMLLSFKGFQVIFRVFVGEVSSNLIGQNFINRFQCQWNYASNLSKDEEIMRGNSVQCIEDSVVPAHCEIVIKAAFDRSANVADGILVPMKTFVFSYGLAVARELVTATTGQNIIYVRVLIQLIVV